MIIDATSLNKQSSEFPDLILDNKTLKLKGGAKVEKIRKFASKTDKLNKNANAKVAKS